MQLIKSSGEKVAKLLKARPLEMKFGEVLELAHRDIMSEIELSEFIVKRPQKYIILGIAEDVGIRANFGNAGSTRSYEDFLSFFVNIQHNQYNTAENAFLLGEIYVDDLQQKSAMMDIEQMRSLVSEIDQRVQSVIKAIVKANKIPILIGGGHNNSYGLISGSAKALGAGIEVINIDPHLDCRPLEGRHSGNGFSYAFHDKFLSRYYAWGVHENYNSQESYNFAEKFTTFETFENILFENSSFDHFIMKTAANIGVELDLDSIKDMPTSAITGCGLTEEDIRIYFRKILKVKKPIYFHIAEGKPSVFDNYKVAKFTSYLVSDIIKFKE